MEFYAIMKLYISKTVNELHQNTEGEMKRKIVAVALCSLMSAYACCGCNPAGNESKNQQTSSTQESNDTANGIPEDVRAKLQAVLDAPPVPVPEEGWTDETLLDVIYINGEKLQVPFSLESLGEGFDYLTDDDSFLHKNDGTYAGITYYGIPCGICSTPITSSVESFRQDTLNMITFDDLMNEEPIELYPISVNGVTYGTSYDDMVSRLGVTDEERVEDPNTSETSFQVVEYTESYRILIYGSKAKVRSITLNVLSK